MTCRDEILAAFRLLTGQTGRSQCTAAEIVEELKRQGTTYQESTIRTHVTSRMCGNAPDHHPVVYDDLERVGRGQYRLRG
jgi:hypothetical protein